MFIRHFSQISKKDVLIAGGKGASLGEMTKAGLPVPPGFVVLAGAFDRFISETEIGADIEAILKKVNHKDINSVEAASKKIRSIITGQIIPKDIAAEISVNFKKLGAKFVAVRSSATAEDSKIASWAGELETYLNVTDKQVLKYVQTCWSSLFTPRAIFYAFEKGFYRRKQPSPSSFAKATADRRPSPRGRGGLGVAVAVVIQKMVQSEVSGIAFTVHPVTKDYNQLVIEAGLGLGEAIVGGLVTPDNYVVHKKELSILDISISEQSMMIVRSPKGNKQQKLSTAVGGKQKLTGKQIIELAKICVGIEKHYKKPQDIEWAFEKNRFYITQSRPITTL